MKRRIVGSIAATALAAGALTGVAIPAQATGASATYSYSATPSISPSTFDFGTVSPGTIVSLAFTVTNSTQSTMNFPTFSGVTIANDVCASQPILAGNTCTFDIRWTPTGSGLASITVVDTANTGPSSGRSITLTATVSSGGGGGGMGGSDVSTITLDSDGVTLRWSTGSMRPLVFCRAGDSYATCNPPNNMLYYVQLQANQTSIEIVEGLSVKRWLGMNATPENVSLPAGDYTIYVDNYSSSSNGLNITVGAGNQAPAPVLVLPAINPSGLPSLSGVVVGSTVKCSVPSFDVEPTSIEISLAVDGAELKRETLTKKPFEVTALVPAASSGKTLMCTVTARNDKGSTTISADAVISAKSAINPSTPVKPTTPGTPATCSGTRVIGFGNAATSLSASGAAAASAFGSAACKYTVTGYSQPSSSRASALAAARANAVAAAIKAANPNAVVTVVNGGKARNAACAKVSNRCVVVSRG